MTEVKVVCVDQSLSLITTPKIASGGRNEVKMTFEFCPLWDGFRKTAVFYQDKDNVYYQNIVDDACIVPHEATENPGYMYFGVFGVDIDENSRTSEVLRYKIVEGAITEDLKPEDPTPDVYAQLLSAITHMDEFLRENIERATAKTIENSTPPVMEAAMEAGIEAALAAIAKKQDRHVSTVGFIPVSSWDKKTMRASVPVDSVLSSDTVFIQPGKTTLSPSGVVLTEKPWYSCNVQCVGQLDGELIFQCEEIPDKDLYFKAVIFSRTGGNGYAVIEDIDLGGFGISGLAAPKDSDDAATKEYVDSVLKNALETPGALAVGFEDISADVSFIVGNYFTANAEYCYKSATQILFRTAAKSNADLDAGNWGEIKIEGVSETVVLRNIKEVCINSAGSIENIYQNSPMSTCLAGAGCGFGFSGLYKQGNSDYSTYWEGEFIIVS